MQDLGELLSPPFFAGQAPGTLMENRPSGGRDEAIAEVQPQEECHQAHGPPDTDPDLEANRHRGCTSHPRYAGARLVGSPLRSHKRSWGLRARPGPLFPRTYPLAMDAARVSHSNLVSGS